MWLRFDSILKEEKVHSRQVGVSDFFGLFFRDHNSLRISS